MLYKSLALTKPEKWLPFPLDSSIIKLNSAMFYSRKVRINVIGRHSYALEFHILISKLTINISSFHIREYTVMNIVRYHLMYHYSALDAKQKGSYFSAHTSCVLPPHSTSPVAVLLLLQPSHLHIVRVLSHIFPLSPAFCVHVAQFTARPFWTI